MIEAAHVGIGLEGLEGKQAVMACDYSLAQFRFLLRLLLVHGAWSYRRLSLLILYSFYKNVTISFLGIWYAFYSGYSAQVFIDAISGTFACGWLPSSCGAGLTCTYCRRRLQYCLHFYPRYAGRHFEQRPVAEEHACVPG